MRIAIVAVAVSLGSGCLQLELRGAPCDDGHPCPGRFQCEEASCIPDDCDATSDCSLGHICSGAGHCVQEPVVGEGEEGEGEGEGEGVVGEPFADGLLCDDDAPTSAPPSFATGSSDVAIPLCAGHVLVADQQTNELVVWNPLGDPAVSYALPAKPTALALDADRLVVWAALGEATRIARAELLTEKVDAVELPAAARDVFVRADGDAIAIVDDPASSFDRQLMLIDGDALSAGAAIALPGVFDAGFVVELPAAAGATPAQATLIVVDAGVTPSTIYRIDVDFDAGTHALAEELRTDGGFGHKPALSPDGAHLVHNGLDYDPLALTTVFGEFDAGTFALPGLYTRDGTRFLAADDFDGAIFVFNAGSHALSSTLSMGSACDYSSLRSVAPGPGGARAFVYTQCGFDGDSGRVFAVALP